MADKKIPEPMDPGAKESSTPVPIDYPERDCYAMEQLVSEVTDLFDETHVNVVDRNGRNVALGVTFTIDAEDGETLHHILTLIEDDDRVEDVRLVNEHTTRVVFYNNAVTQDIRTPFDLDDMYAAYVEPGDDK